MKLLDNLIHPGVKNLFPAQPDRLPLYIQEPWATVGISSERLIVTRNKEELGSFKMKDVSQLVLCGNISVTEACLRKLCESEIPIVHMSGDHWFYGITQGQGEKNAFDRFAQFQCCSDKKKSLTLAKEFIRAKAKNQRTLLRRNATDVSGQLLKEMKELIEKIDKAKNIEQLRAIEGHIAALYFANFSRMINNDRLAKIFNTNGRSRRPATDPINAMLNFGYALLAKEVQLALSAEGLDPWWGVMHTPRNGKPAMALDAMEEFRPLIIDSLVLSLVNNNRINENEFSYDDTGCRLETSARKALLHEYESRMRQTMTHPQFKNECSWRTAIAIQAKEISRFCNCIRKNYTGIVQR